MAAITTLTTKVHREIGVNSAVDRIPVEHIIQEDSNNEIQPSTSKNNAINLTINMDQYIYIYIYIYIYTVMSKKR